MISGNHINTNIASHLIIKQPWALATLPVFIQTCWMVSGDTIVSVVLHIVICLCICGQTFSNIWDSNQIMIMETIH